MKVGTYSLVSFGKNLRIFQKSLEPLALLIALLIAVGPQLYAAIANVQLLSKNL